jgi:hypothetical protein
MDHAIDSGSSTAVRTESWTVCRWARPQIKTLRDLYESSFFCDDVDCPFDDILMPLRDIIVPVPTYPTHPDFIRGIKEAETIRITLLSFQKNVSGQGGAASEPAPAGTSVPKKINEGEGEALECSDCGDFVFSAHEQALYKKTDFDNEPIRCVDCKAARKFSFEERGVAVGSGRVGRGRGGRGSRGGTTHFQLPAFLPHNVFWLAEIIALCRL